VSSNRKLKRVASALVVTAILTSVGAACSSSTANTSSMCSFVLGDGSKGHDRKVHDVVYPDDNVDYNSDTEDVRYVPCNARNFIINDGSVTYGADQKVGDRSNPSVGYTSDGTKVNGFTSSYWTLNQDEEALRAFWAVCDKYKCSSDDAESGDANFSTEGWNGMLAENFGPSVDDAFRIAVAEVDDEVWQHPTPELEQQMSDRMSAAFADAVRAKTGYELDIFCGSGNSGWDDVDKPGEGDFLCTSVRIELDGIIAANSGTQQSSEEATQAQSELESNAARLAAAEALYGPSAGYWLGLMDVLDKCKGEESHCDVNIGNPPGVPVSQ